MSPEVPHDCASCMAGRQEERGSKVKVKPKFVNRSGSLDIFLLPRFLFIHLVVEPRKDTSSLPPLEIE